MWRVERERGKDGERRKIMSERSENIKREREGERKRE